MIAARASSDKFADDFIWQEARSLCRWAAAARIVEGLHDDRCCWRLAVKGA